jgi:hypothetical protein
MDMYNISQQMYFATTHNLFFYVFPSIYRSRYDESREQVPEGVEGVHDDCSNLQIRCDRYAHHAVVGEREDDEKHEEEEVEEFGSSPFIVDHGIDNGGIYHGLSKYVRNLDSCLNTTTKGHISRKDLR